MKTADLDKFDFNLPEHLLASSPAETRGKSRLMTVNIPEKSVKTGFFDEITSFLGPNDVLVMNNTRVSKRRVYLRKGEKEFEAVFLEPSAGRKTWKCLIKNAKKLHENDSLVTIRGGFSFTFFRKNHDLFLSGAEPVSEDDFELMGDIPIPPYLKRRATPEDNIRYQTVYAEKKGSVAAPTAGLHFTEELLEKIRLSGCETVYISLTVGYGTFRPLEDEDFASNRLHREEYHIPEQSADILNRAKKDGKKIISVGTTTLRALESAYDHESGSFRPGSSHSEIFLKPGDRINSVNGLVTNFHLPRSSLLLLVAAFAGEELVMRAYRQAIEDGFRFYSYGDAMFLQR